MSTKQARGFSPVIVVIALAAILAAGLITWRIYDSNQTASQNEQASNLPQNENPAPGQPAADPNQGYVVIEEWGVRFKPTAGLTGVEYFRPSAANANEVTFTTAELSSSSAACRKDTGNIILGLLARSTTEDPQLGGVKAKVGDYYYQYRGPQAMCSEDGTLESSTVSSLMRSLDTIEAAK